MDQLGQVFDRIDVVVRRRADQAHAGRGVADAGDVLVHLAARQLAAFAGLGPLRHLDLQFVGVGQVPDGHAEAAGGDLLDGGAPRVAVGQRLEAFGILAAFARVAAAAQAVHGDGQRLVGFCRDRAEAHRAGAETFDDFAGRLDFLQRDRSAVGSGPKPQQAAQRKPPPGVVVQSLGKPPVGVLVSRAGGHLQVGDRLRVPAVPLAFRPPVELAGVGQHRATGLRERCG